MKTGIYYFTGTGNSLMIAKKFKEKLDNVELLPIAGLLDNDVIDTQYERVGFVFPLYFYGLPRIIESFFNKLDMSRIKYSFIVITAQYPNGMGIQQAKMIFDKKEIKLNSAFYVKMPTNYTIFFNSFKEDKQNKIIAEAFEKTENIIRIIKENRDKIEKESLIYNFVLRSRSSYHKWSFEVKELDKKFSITDNCNSCGICEKVCPVKNISFDNNKPSWNGQCEQCLGCYNNCPKNAIEYGNKTSKLKRYKNQNIKLNELIQ